MHHGVSVAMYHCTDHHTTGESKLYGALTLNCPKKSSQGFPVLKLNNRRL